MRGMFKFVRQLMRERQQEGERECKAKALEEARRLLSDYDYVPRVPK